MQPGRCFDCLVAVELQTASDPRMSEPGKVLLAKDSSRCDVNFFPFASLDIFVWRNKRSVLISFPALDAHQDWQNVPRWIRP